MKTRRFNKLSKGFALPTVLIASVVMLIVLTSGLVAATSSNLALRNQYETRILNQAAEAGKAFVVGCLAQTGGVSNWVILYPNSNCTTTANTNLCPDTGAPSACFLVDQTSANGPLVKTTFTVGAATNNTDGSRTILITGILRYIKQSDGSTAREAVVQKPLDISGTNAVIVWDSNHEYLSQAGVTRSSSMGATSLQVALK